MLFKYQTRDIDDVSTMRLYIFKNYSISDKPHNCFPTLYCAKISYFFLERSFFNFFIDKSCTMGVNR